jgi:hypothetical protein
LEKIAMSNTYVLFVGGPLDGTQRVLPHVGRQYHVAMYPKIEPVAHGVPDQVCLVDDRFTYEGLRLAGKTFYVPAEWLHTQHIGADDPYERLVTALSRGYVGRQ